MKYGVAGRSKEFFRKRKQIRSPGPGGHDPVIARNVASGASFTLSIFQDNAFNAIIVLIECRKLAALVQFDAERFRALDKRRNGASAFNVARVGIEEAVLKPFRIKRGKPIAQPC